MSFNLKGKRNVVDAAKNIVDVSKFLQDNHKLIANFLAKSEKYRTFELEFIAFRGVISFNLSVYEEDDTHHYLIKLTKTDLKRILKELKNES